MSGTPQRLMRIDLHTHSTASDGVLPPARLVRVARDAGLDVVALTDHDTCGGWSEAAQALPDGLTLVPGAELSCRWFGEDPPISVHLLAYLFDPAYPALAAEMGRIRELRDRRAERTVELLRADGIDVTWAEIRAAAAGGSVGRPHLARALVRHGVVNTLDEAFGPDWLGGRYRLHKADTEVFAALELARAAGGVVVFAHPRAVRRGRIVPDSLIADLAAAGLAGLEADHPDHGPDERAHVRALAQDLGLVVTGSSDFHGTRDTIRPGANTTAPEVYERIVEAGTGVVPVRKPG